MSPPQPRRVFLLAWLLGCAAWLSLCAGAHAQGQLINGNRTLVGTLNHCADTGTTNAYSCNLNPALPAYLPGAFYSFTASTANTGTVTLALNGLAALPVVKMAGAINTLLTASDIRAGQVVVVYYDNTNFQMISQVGVIVGVAQGGTGATTFTAGLARSSGGTTALTTVTGTTGYLPYWSSNSLAQSPLYTDGTNVGLGTSSLEALATLNQTSGAIVLALKAPTNQGTALMLTNTSGTQKNWIVAKNYFATGVLTFAPSTTNGGTTFTTPTLNLTTDGNVGIGTTAFGTSSAGGVVSLGAATGATTSPAGVVQFWGANVAGAATAGINIRDEQGNTYAIGNGTISISGIKSTTGVRYVCVDTNGNLLSQAAACSGT